MELIDDGGFADAGISGNEHEFRLAARNNSIESREKRADLAVASIQSLRDAKMIRRVVTAQYEIPDQT
jgi:hypothetical protein